MSERETLFSNWKQTKQEVRKLIEQFPENKREEILFDKWSLKDVVAHLSNWMEDDLHALTNLKQGKKSYWEPDMDAFNAAGVARRKELEWQLVYEEFLLLMAKLEQAYETLPDHLWNAEMWENHAGNPLRSITVDIEHWKEEHIPSLTQKLNESKF